MISEFINGFFSYLKALRFIHKHRLYRYFILSGIISLILGAFIFGLAYTYSDNIASYLLGWYPFDMGSTYIAIFLSYAAGITIGIIGFILFKHILLALISPMMGSLSSQVESILSGKVQESKSGLKQTGYELIRGFRISIRNIIREVMLTLILLLLGMIPLLTIFIVPIIFIVQSYYTGFANFDYFLERRLNIRHSILYIRRHRWQVIGNGAAFLLLLVIPILGLFLAPVLSTVAATMVIYGNEDID